MTTRTGTKKETPSTIVDPVAYRMAQTVIDLEEQIKALEKRKNDAKAVLQEAMEVYRGESDEAKKFVVACELGEIVVTFVDSSSSSVKRDLLLEAGVKPSVVDEATVVRPYTYIRVAPTKEVQFE